MDDWSQLKFWQSGEFQVMQERLQDLAVAGIMFNPPADKLFAALDATKFNDVKVVIMGQDPYPDSRFATGIAFDIPPSYRKFPVTLSNILREYSEDLGYPFPKSGSLKKWTKHVLLWNTIPSCEAGKPLSHEGWFEWQFLTKEIVESLAKREQPLVFCFLGGRAREYVKYVTGKSKVIETSHPSPRGMMVSRVPFLGSRLFTTANAYLTQLGQKPVDWRL